MVMQAYAPDCSYRPCETLPVVAMDDLVFSKFLNRGSLVVVRSQAMDLTSRPDLIKQPGWDDNVRLVIGLGGNSSPRPTDGDSSVLYGITGVSPVSNGDISAGRVISFNSAKDFATVSAAKEYVGTENYMLTQKMITSFSAHFCTGLGDEPKSYTVPGNMSGPDLCAQQPYIHQDGAK